MRRVLRAVTEPWSDNSSDLADLASRTARSGSMRRGGVYVGGGRRTSRCVVPAAGGLGLREAVGVRRGHGGGLACVETTPEERRPVQPPSVCSGARDGSDFVRLNPRRGHPSARSASGSAGNAAATTWVFRLQVRPLKATVPWGPAPWNSPVPVRPRSPEHPRPRRSAGSPAGHAGSGDRGALSHRSVGYRGSSDHRSRLRVHSEPPTRDVGRGEL